MQFLSRLKVLNGHTLKVSGFQNSQNHKPFKIKKSKPDFKILTENSNSVWEMYIYIML